MGAAHENSINARFCTLCQSLPPLDGGSKELVLSISRELDDIAIDLAEDKELRATVGIDEPTIWPTLQHIWGIVSEKAVSQEDDESTRIIITSICRFTRNLVAGVAENQRNAFENEPSLRRILHVYSSWTSSQDPGSFPLVRMAVQTLSNMVTANENLLSHLWEKYLNMSEDQAIFVRLLNSPDPRTLLSLLIFLVNCTHENSTRQSLLANTRGGSRICITLLDRMIHLHDAEESTDSGRAFDHGYHLFAQLFQGGLAPDLYGNLKVDGEVIVPHQTVLLKLLDSYLQSSSPPKNLVGLAPMLTACFFELSTFSCGAIERAVGSQGTETTNGNTGMQILPECLDLLLPKTCEALVLVIQCISTILLGSKTTKSDNASTDNVWVLFRRTLSPDGRVVAEKSVELLRLLDVFLPRINFGKPVGSSVSPGLTAADDPTGFSYLKRDLVRLLGILCHKDKQTQDCIRACAGIPVIMNMCVIDERNPYLREHAIFTIHNLLEGNNDNQAVVNSIQLSDSRETKQECLAGSSAIPQHVQLAR